MRLRVLFVDYSKQAGSDVMPNAMAVVDEYMEDEHGGIPDFFQDEVAKYARDGTCEISVAIVEVPDSFVTGLFETQSVQGKPVGRAEDS